MHAVEIDVGAGAAVGVGAFGEDFGAGLDSD